METLETLARLHSLTGVHVLLFNLENTYSTRPKVWHCNIKYEGGGDKVEIKREAVSLEAAVAEASAAFEKVFNVGLGLMLLEAPVDATAQGEAHPF